VQLLLDWILIFISTPAGKDATQVFFGLHRLEVLQRPQYARLQIGAIRGQTETIKPLGPGELSLVPYAEPTWLTPGYFSPYYNDNHRKFHKAMRAFLMEVVQPEAIRCEENGKRISQEVVDKLRQTPLREVCVIPLLMTPQRDKFPGYAPRARQASQWTYLDGWHREA
jgi:hypothetical protein